MESTTTSRVIGVVGAVIIALIAYTVQVVTGSTSAALVTVLAMFVGMVTTGVILTYWLNRQ